MSHPACNIPHVLRRGLALLSVLVLGAVWPLGALAQSSTPAAQADAPALAETITFKQPRVSGAARMQLRRFAQKIVTSRKDVRNLQQVIIDVYINPGSDEFMHTAAANMSNEVARRLVRYGVPRDKISRSLQAQERATTKPGTYDVDLKAVPAP